eukprot:4579239-Prymnesium_polylepis.1
MRSGTVARGAAGAEAPEGVRTGTRRVAIARTVRWPLTLAEAPASTSARPSASPHPAGTHTRKSAHVVRPHAAHRNSLLLPAQ